MVLQFMSIETLYLSKDIKKSMDIISTKNFYLKNFVFYFIIKFTIII